MKAAHSIDILLAVYNNGAFLADQLQSLLNQTIQDFHIIARDDGSTDNSVDILHTFSDKNPGKMTLIKGRTNCGAKGNFATLLLESKAPYIMFCDADDIWLKDKIEKTWILMKHNEDKFGSHIPLLVHTNLSVVDRDLRWVDPSFWNYSHIQPKHASCLNRLLIQNSVTGCTIMMNQPLSHLVSSIPHEAIMHDWWISLVACSLGHIDFLNGSTILYRQHDNNDTGAKNWRDYSLYLKRMIEFFSWQGRQNMRNVFFKTIDQAESFYNHYQSLLKEKDKKILRSYISLKQARWMHKCGLILKYRFLKHSFLKNIGLLLT